EALICGAFGPDRDASSDDPVVRGQAVDYINKCVDFARELSRRKLLFFALNGLFVGVAAMLLLSRVGAAQQSTGTGIELQAIGAVVIGGAPMSGGKGNAFGTFCGVLLWGVIGNALNMMQVDPYIQDVVIGLLIIFAVAVSSLR